MAVSWLGSAEGGSAELHLRRVAASGRAGPDQVIAEAIGVAPFSVPQLMLVEEQLLLAWTDSSGDDSRVRTALVPLSFLGKPVGNGD